MPTYLKDDWFRDWGALQRLVQFYPNAQPARLELGYGHPQRLVEPGSAPAVLSALGMGRNARSDRTLGAGVARPLSDVAYHRPSCPPTASPAW